MTSIARFSAVQTAWNKGTLKRFSALPAKPRVPFRALSSNPLNFLTLAPTIFPGHAPLLSHLRGGADSSMDSGAFYPGVPGFFPVLKRSNEFEPGHVLPS